MSQRDPEATGKRRHPVLLIVGLATAAAITLAFAVALVIHFMLLGTDQFNWLEPPKQSERVSPTQTTILLPRAEKDRAVENAKRRPADS